MVKLQHRSVVYKVTLAFMYFIFLVYAVAFSIPTWFGARPQLVLGFKGLWVLCLTNDDVADFSNCGKYAFGDDSDWFDGVRGLWIAGMFFYVVAVVYSIVENCCSDEDSKDRGVTGILAILAGLCGAVGVIVAAIEIEENSLNFDYYWGYMLACITSGLTLILAIILLITCNVRSSEKPRDDRTADYVFAHKQGIPQAAPEYTNHGYSRDEIPLASGVTYQHTPSAHPYTMYQDGYNNGYPQGRSHVDVYAQPAKSPYGYYNGRPNHLHNPSDANTAMTDLSNGYTNELINAEHTLTRSNVGQRGDFVRPAADYGRQEFLARNDNYPNGSRIY
uniref:Uncharacterized protein n=1 Tax=Arion vulgaris TaxID=1028688 RepID=A0A0B7A7S9_9EUPU